MLMARGTPTYRKRSVIAHPNDKARAGMLAAMAELYSDKPGLVGEAALGERERLRIEDEAKATGQGVLPLGSHA